MNGVASKYHLGKTSYVLNLIDGLKDAGAPVEKLISKSSLRYFKLDEPEQMIPVSVIYDFFELVQRDQGVDNMGKTFHRYFTLESIGAYGFLLASSKRLLSTIHTAMKYEKLNLSHDNCSFQLFGETAFFGNRYGGEKRLGRDILSDIDLAIMLDVLKISNTEGWAPVEIYLENSNSALIESLFPNSNIKIRTGKKRYGIVFDSESLTNSLVSEDHVERLNVDLMASPENLSGRLELLFESLSSGYLPGIAEVGRIFNTSESSIKRGLAAEGMSFSELLDQWRFRKAIELLTKTSSKINEISDQLYYSNTPNFIRAFKRWSGLNPTAFR